MVIYFRHVDDIDLFSGAVSEFPASGAVVGPTFGCILASQFRNARHGDRFWYENQVHNTHPFTSGREL